MKNKVILFDLDGTLINSDMLIIRSYMHLFDTYRPDYKLTLKELISFLGPTLRDTFPKYFKEDFDVLLKGYRTYFKENIDKYLSLFDGVEDMLITFKNQGIKMGVVTNRYRDSAFEVINQFNLSKYFDVVITLDEISKEKPSPEGIIKAIDLLKCKSEDVIYVGDNKSDYQASRGAKVMCALVSFPVGRDNSLLKPDILINSFEKFKKEIINGKY